jgi:serine/threonine protein kinase
MIGQRLGQWTLQAVVGRGAMGTVYEATGDDGRTAAIKVLAPDLARDELLVQRFEREIAALKQLQHPHIVAYYDSGRSDQAIYLAMEFVAGSNYEQRLQTRGRLPWTEVLTVGRQVTEALKHAHDRGVIHRDLKPANILVVGDPDGPVGVNIKLTDFGVAKLFASPPLTAAGSFVGTASYLAPEQAAGKPASKRGDFYSLGCVLYALTTGRPPFLADTTSAMVHQHRFAQVEQPIRLVPEIPHDLNSLIMQLLEKDPERRPADGSVLLKQIDRIIGKLERQGRGNETIVDRETDATKILQSTLVEGQAVGPGPATLAAGFVRSELERQNRGGLLNRLFNHPAVIIPLFLLCVAGIIYGIWRPHPSAEQLMNSARPLMQSTDPADWRKAWREYLEPLTERFLNHGYEDEIAQFRQRLDDQGARERLLLRLKSKSPPSEAERFYRLGLQSIENGDIAGARRIWTNLIAGFGQSAPDQRWVQLARDGLNDLKQVRGTDRASVTAALDRARELKSRGQTAEAEAIWNALEQLYRHDPDGLDVIEQIKRDREH